MFGRFNPRMRNIRAGRVYRYFPTAWRYNQIHVFHRRRAKENLISQYQRSDKTYPFSKTNPDRTHIEEHSS